MTPPTPLRIALATLVCSLLLPAPGAGQVAGAQPGAAGQTAGPPVPPLPRLPAPPPGAPRGGIEVEDRRFYPQGPWTWPEDYAGTGSPVIVSATLPAGPKGTGSELAEPFEYQLPTTYDPDGPPIPLVIGYHGYGSSAKSVALQSTLDEECEVRGWAYLSPTGGDDQLFGSWLVQKNVNATIRFMLDNFNIDPDRIYMVGFSMGGGIAFNFAARNRDPDGIMIAAVGSVAGSFDWTMEYDQGSPGLQSLMEHPYNFGGPPGQFPFSYQLASAMVFDPATWPPVSSAQVDPDLSMGSNLQPFGVYMTYDQADWTQLPQAQNGKVWNFVKNLGGSSLRRVQSGTVNPQTGFPAPHSWYVLDEVELFDFFALHTANRTPGTFEGQVFRDTAVSWARVTQNATTRFTFLHGDAQPAAGSVTLDEVSNANRVTLNGSDAQIAGATAPRVTATSADANGFTLEVTAFEDPVAYFLDAATGQFLPGTRSTPITEGAPGTGSILRDVPGLGTLDVQVVTDPTWSAGLSTRPPSVVPGDAVEITLDAAPSAMAGLVALGTAERLTTLPDGLTLTLDLASIGPLYEVPLDEQGNARFVVPIPAKVPPGLDRILMQALVLDENGSPSAVSNLWVLDLD